MPAFPKILKVRLPSYLSPTHSLTRTPAVPIVPIQLGRPLGPGNRLLARQGREIPGQGYLPRLGRAARQLFEGARGGERRGGR